MALDGIRNLPREEQFKAAAQYAGVTPDVLDGIWKTESGRGQSMLSSAGAEGHFQIMPDTRASLQKRFGKKLDPYNFTDGLVMAAELMRENMQAAGGDIRTALQMYHGGWDRKDWGPLTNAYPGKVMGTNNAGSYGTSVPVAPTRSSIQERVEAGWEASDPRATALADEGWKGTDATVAALTALRDTDSAEPTSYAKALGEFARTQAVARGAEADAAVEAGAVAQTQPERTTTLLQDYTRRDAVSPTQAVSDETRLQSLHQEHSVPAELDMLDRWGAHFNSGITASLGRAIADLADNETRPLGWSYVDHADEYEVPGLSNSDLAELRQSRSPSEVRRAQDRIMLRHHSEGIISRMGTWENFATGALAGISDPVAALAGAGTAGAFGLAGISSGAMIRAGRPLAALGASAAEGAVGNIVVDAGLVMAGEKRSLGDFALDAGFGMLFGGAVGIKGYMDADVVRLGNAIITDRATRNADALVAARAELGDNTTPELLQQRAVEIANETESAWARAQLRDVASDDRFFPRADVGDRTPDTAVNITTVPNRYVATVRGGDVHLAVREANGARYIEVVDEEGNLLKDSLGRDAGRLIFSDAVREGQSISVRVSPEFQRRGIATAFYRLARDLGGDIGDAQTGAFRSGRTAVRSEEGQAFRSAADLDAAQVRPLQQARPVSSNGPLPGAMISRERRAIVQRYSLDRLISDDSERILIAEALNSTERILSNNNVDSARLQTWLQRANLEATSTTMLSSESPVARALGIMLLENPEGAAGRRATTAALQRAALYEEYMGGAIHRMDTAYDLWLQERQIGRFSAAIRQQDVRAQWNRALSEELLHRQQGRTVTSSRAVREAADALDARYLRSLSDQRYVGVVGASRLPEGGESGYFHRQWMGQAFRALNPVRREAVRRALMDQFVRTGEMYDDAFVNNLSIEFMERLERNAIAAANQEATLYSSDTADILRDSLKAAGLNEAQINEQLNRFGRGGAAHTKGRIDLDMTAEYPDGEGGVFRLMDFIEQDQAKLLRQYAARAAGEVALAKYGIQGTAGIKILREALRVTNADGKTIKAFDQVMAEMLGQRVGDGDPTLLTNIRLLTNMTRLGGAFFPQMGVYGDAVGVLGGKAVFDAIGATPRLIREVHALARGEAVRNPIIGGLETAGADFGASDYRIVGLGQIDEHASLSGRESVGILTQAIRYGSNGVRILSGHRLLVAIQTRGLAEQIVQKAWKFIRDGGEDRALADMGFDSGLVARLRGAMDTVVDWDEAGNVRVFDLNRALGTDHEATMIAFRNAVMRGAGQLLQREFVGETGKWAHSGLLKMLFQFRTFSLVAHQKQLGRNIAVHGAGKAAMIVAGAASIAIPVHLARVALRASLMTEEDRSEYLSKNMAPLAVGRQVMNYVSGLGLLPDVLDLGSGVASGWAETAGLNVPEWAKPTGGRTMSQSQLLGGQFAPGIGLVNDYGQLAAGNLKKLRTSVPGSTLPYIAPILAGAESHMKDDE